MKNNLEIYIEQLKRSFAIVEKNLRIYYSKGMVIIMGLMMPFFLFLAFSVGKNMQIGTLVPGLLGMTIFFTATAIGPAIIPWETRSKTLEMLISTPITIYALFIGDVLSSFIYGLIVSLIPFVVVLPFTSISLMHLLILSLSIVLGAFCFASLGILLSIYPPSDIPATIMMLTSLVKFPLVFISGVFIPIEDMPLLGRMIASFSPLTYLVDLMKYSLQGVNYYPTLLDLAVLIAFTIIFSIAGIKLQEKTLSARFS